MSSGAGTARHYIRGGEIPDSGRTTKELLLRWAELAALTPFYRLPTPARP